MRLPWVRPEELLRHELDQSAAEGRDVSAVLHRWVLAGGVTGLLADGLAPEPSTPELTALARELLKELDALPEIGVAEEPSGWPEILAAVSDQLPLPAARPSPTELRDRVHGAWLGRAAGCVLGKPVEKIPRAGIEENLRSQGPRPLDRWFTAAGLDPDVSPRAGRGIQEPSHQPQENLDGTPGGRRPQLHPVGAEDTSSSTGPSFTPDDVAHRLAASTCPAGRTFTAERVAYRNLLDGIGPPQSARVPNPFRSGSELRSAPTCTAGSIPATEAGGRMGLAGRVGQPHPERHLRCVVRRRPRRCRGHPERAGGR